MVSNDWDNPAMMHNLRKYSFKGQWLDSTEHLKKNQKNVAYQLGFMEKLSKRLNDEIIVTNSRTSRLEYDNGLLLSRLYCQMFDYNENSIELSVVWDWRFITKRTRLMCCIKSLILWWQKDNGLEAKYG